PMQKENRAGDARGILNWIMRKPVETSLVSAPEHEQFSARKARHSHCLKAVSHRVQHLVKHGLHDDCIWLHPATIDGSEDCRRSHRLSIEHYPAVGQVRPRVTRSRSHILGLVKSDGGVGFRGIPRTTKID